MYILSTALITTSLPLLLLSAPTTNIDLSNTIQNDLSAPVDRKFTCLNRNGGGSSTDHPTLIDCMNSFLRIPPRGDKQTFVRPGHSGADHNPVLPQQAFGAKCSTQIDFLNADAQEEATSWLAIRMAASELAFYCAKAGTLTSPERRTTGIVVVGDRGLIRITIKKGTRNDWGVGNGTETETVDPVAGVVNGTGLVDEVVNTS